MHYIVMISHGEFAEGLHQTLTMFVGEKEDVLSIGLKQGEDVHHLASRIMTMMERFHEEDSFLILADIIGGSPLTTLMDCFEKKGLLKQSSILGGMNLAVALNAVLMKEDLQQAKAMAIQEGKEAIKEVVLEDKEEEEI